jgi:tetratricopeptide (TPR) repeat protein
VAAVWGLHPVLTEAVTNIIGRTDLLAAFGVLAGLLCHIHGAAETGRRKLAWLAGLALSAAIGIFSKESAVVMVAVMAVFDLAYRNRDAWRASIPGYLALAPPFLTFFYLRTQVFSKLPPFHFPVTDNPIVGAPFWTGRLTAIHVIGKYIAVLSWPVTLACDHTYNDIPLVTWQALPALALCLGAAAAAYVSWRRRKAVFWFVLFFFVTLAPVSNIVIPIGTIMAERLLYLPSIGFAGCLVLALYAASERLHLSPRAAVMVLVLICLAFMYRTWTRNQDWQNSIALWTSAVESAPNSAKAHTTLASAVADTGDAGLARAVAEITRARQIMDTLPDEKKTPVPYIDAGSYYGQQGDFDKALASLERAREIETATNRANHTDGSWYELYIQLGGVYMKRNDLPKALEVLEYGRDHRPVPDFFEQISVVYFQMRDLHHAAIALHEGRIMFPYHPRFDPALQVLYQNLDPRGCAPTLARNCPQVHNDACVAARNLVPMWQRLHRAPPPMDPPCVNP